MTNGAVVLHHQLAGPEDARDSNVELPRHHSAHVGRPGA